MIFVMKVYLLKEREEYFLVQKPVTSLAIGI